MTIPRWENMRRSGTEGNFECGAKSTTTEELFFTRNVDFQGKSYFLDFAYEKEYFLLLHSLFNPSVSKKAVDHKVTHENLGHKLRQFVH